MSQEIFWDYLSVFVNGELVLNIHGSDADAWDRGKFVLGNCKAVAVGYVLEEELFEKLRLL
eukprot:scaffold5629_cov48-Cyclotella_meneghiniana.AAC.6